RTRIPSTLSTGSLCGCGQGTHWGGLTARPLFIAIASAFLSLFSWSAIAAPENVQLVAVEPQAPLLKEALLRLEAELSSLGFEVIHCEQSDATDLCVLGSAVGRIELAVSTD